MSLKILCIEDEQAERDLLIRAVETYNAKEKWPKIEMEVITSLAAIDEELKKSVDLVLADVYLRNDDGTEEFRLKEVIDAVERVRRQQNHQRAVPVIAYTGKGIPALEFCLNHDHQVLDVWPKFVYSPRYIVWRLTRLAQERLVSGSNRVLQRAIERLQLTGDLHGLVVEMCDRYDSGWTEVDRLERAGLPIEKIAELLDLGDLPGRMWKTTCGWDFLARASSPKVRGHGRHVANVFWLGYLVLNHPALESWFRAAWKGLIENRTKMKGVAAWSSGDFFNRAWYLAALFHDSMLFAERQSVAFERIRELARLSGNESLAAVVSGAEWTVRAAEIQRTGIEDLEPDLRNRMETVIGATLDHGIIAAGVLRNWKRGQPRDELRREAGRAMAVHNAIAAEESGDWTIQWQDDPIAALLVFFDQLQTWHRERGDEHLYKEDWPERAELCRIEVTMNGHRPTLELHIDYIVKRHVLETRELLDRVRDKLELLLMNKPAAVIKKLVGAWPFDLRVTFSIGGSVLGTKLERSAYVMPS